MVLKYSKMPSEPIYKERKNKKWLSNIKRKLKTFNLMKVLLKYKKWLEALLLEDNIKRRNKLPKEYKDLLDLNGYMNTF